MPVPLLLLSACVGAALVASALPVLLPLRLLAARLPGARMRSLARLLLLLAVYVAVFECGALLAAARLRATGRHLPPADSGSPRTPSERQLRCRTRRFFHYGFPIAGMHVRRHGPAPHLPADRPVLVIARHAGFLNAQLLTHELSNTLDRRVLAIAKRSILAAPGFGGLVPGTLMIPYRWNFHGRACALRRIMTMARSAIPGDALLLFPEGTNATAARRRAALDRLHSEERPERVARYRRLRHVLAPQATGVRTVLAAAPGMDVLFFAHTGLEDLLAPLVDIGYPLRADGVLHTRWWHVPAERVPRERAAFEAWLDDWWQSLDEWIAAVRTDPRPVLPAQPQPARPAAHPARRSAQRTTAGSS